MPSPFRPYAFCTYVLTRTLVQFQGKKRADFVSNRRSYENNKKGEMWKKAVAKTQKEDVVVLLEHRGLRIHHCCHCHIVVIVNRCYCFWCLVNLRNFDVTTYFCCYICTNTILLLMTAVYCFCGATVIGIVVAAAAVDVVAKRIFSLLFLRFPRYCARISYISRLGKITRTNYVQWPAA